MLPTLDVDLFGACLMAATPGGPVQNPRGCGRWLPDEREEQAAHFGHRQGEQLDECHPIVCPRSVARSFLTLRPPLGPCGACARTTVR